MGTTDDPGASEGELRRLRDRVAELERRLARYSESGTEPLPGSALGVTVSEREELLVEAERLAQIGSWFWNVETNDVHWSEGLYRIFGFDPARDRASIDAFFGAVHPGDLERVRAASARTATEGAVEEAAFRILRRDGTVRHVTMSSTRLYDAAGKLRRIVGACVDTTEAHEARRSLERKTAELEEAQAVASVGSWVLDADTGAVEWSAELRRILGAPNDVEPSMFELVERVAVEDRARLRDLHERILGGASDGRVEVRLALPRGGARVVVAREVAQRGPDGRLRLARGTLEDVTEARSIAAQATHGQKMEAIGRLAGGVAHDLNNHLMVIQGSLHLMRLPLSDELETVLGAVESARQTAARLLAFGRKSTLRKKSVAVDDLVRRNVLLLAPVITADVTLEVALGSDVPPIEADDALFGQCLVNLVLNARDAIRAGGHIVVRTTHDPGSPFVEVRVEDDGEGMDPETRERAFEPFFTTKPVGMGSGLGLSMVQGTLEQHGGTVALTSTPGRGTLVTMRWPVARPRPATDAPARPTAPVAPATILLVEDQASLARMVQRLLEADGHRVLLARFPSRAIEIAIEQRGEIDLVLSDVVMPEMRGPTMIEAITERAGIRPAVVFMSGYPPEDVDLGQNVPLLRKPFTLETMREVLGAALGDARARTRSGLRPSPQPPQ